MDGGFAEGSGAVHGVWVRGPMWDSFLCFFPSFPGVKGEDFCVGVVACLFEVGFVLMEVRFC